MRPGPDAYRDPPLECDLVLKGGFTSGVVYPSAILELGKRYRFRSIGGASSGAIAAAAAAAAEHGRAQGGFDKLRQLQERFLEPGFLPGLFQPSRPTAPLYRLVLDRKAQAEAAADPARAAPLRGALASIARAVPRELWEGRAGGALVGALAAAALLAPAGLTLARAPGAAAGVARLWFGATLGLALGIWIAAAYLGGLLAAGRALGRAYRALADRDHSAFGFCLGSAGEAAGEERTQLTDWLSERLNDLAGLEPRGAPLTIGMLKRRAPSIDLELVTTNLSHARPYLFPQQEGLLLFRVADMARLFPPEVVEHLTKTPFPLAGARLPEGYGTLPTGDDLPVVVATRLSLSFPVLLGAVRLYTLRPAALAAARRAPGEHLFAPSDLEENWFSDGGIAENFPISMFDHWFPRRPTFGINLHDAPTPSRLPRALEGAMVFRPRAGATDALLPRPAPIQGFFPFFLAILDTARSYRDNTQMALASYRERVVQVCLEPQEGGINLAPPVEVVACLQRKGELAASRLLDPRDGFDFAEHRWVRLRLLLAHLERELRLVAEAHGGDPARLREDWRALFQQQLARAERGEPWYCPAGPDWCEEAEARLAALLEMMQTWRERERAWKQAHAGERHPFFEELGPTPAGALRVTPEI